MKIAIIGAGFTGLTAAYELAKKRHKVVVFEKNSFLGGLAGGIQKTLPTDKLHWEWDLEQFYHHWFINDNHMFQLGKELNRVRLESLIRKFIIKRPITSILYNDQIFPFDSPLNLLLFPHLNPAEKIKTAFYLAKLKYLYREKSSQVFENITAHEYLQKNLGKNTYQKLWEPLLKGKFGDYYQKINMRWFWARIYKRTPKLAYFEGGFSVFIQALAEQIEQLGGRIHLNTQIQKIKAQNPKFKCQMTNEIQISNDKFQIITNPPLKESSAEFNQVIVTTPPRILSQLFDNLPSDYSNKLHSFKSLGAYSLILSLRHPLMRKTYWLNINDLSWPFLTVVEHTNFMPPEKYNHERIIYIGDYLPADHPHMQMNKDELIYKFTPFLKRINPLFSEESIIRSFLFKAPHAQYIVGINHEEKILPIETPIPNVYLASMAQVYPWDRGTNYAIELGQNIAKTL